MVTWDIAAYSLANSRPGTIYWLLAVRYMALLTTGVRRTTYMVLEGSSTVMEDVLSMLTGTQYVTPASKPEPSFTVSTISSDMLFPALTVAVSEERSNEPSGA